MDKISALMDGELTREEAVGVVADIRARGAAREAWATYHLIGDALRGEPCGDCGVLPAVARRLAGEPTVLAPRRMPQGFGSRWALPSLAAAAAVAAVTWIVAETQQGPAMQPVAAPGQQTIVPAVAVQSLPEYVQPVNLPPQASPPPPIQFSAREFEAYLRAHQEFSPSNFLQGLAPYVRNVRSGAVETGR